MEFEAKLSDYADVIMGQSPPGERVFDYEKGLPLLNGPTEFGLSHPIPVQWTDDVRKQCKKGDILFCVRGSTTGRMNWADQPYAIGRGIAAIRGANGIDTRFVRAVIEAGLADLLAVATGSTFPNLARNDLLSTVAPKVSPEESSSIGFLLAAFDNRINHNRALAANLEAIARRLFKSWFVDFDPVRAKAAGEKPPGLADDISPLFPDRFVDSELGEIPEGWKCCKVSDLCEAIFSGGTPHTQTTGYWGGNLPWLSSGETRSRFIVGTEKSITKAGVDNSSTRLARTGDVVIASAGQGATRGQTSLLAIDTYINQSVVALRASQGSYSSALLFLDLSSRYDEMRAISDSHSSRGSLTTKLLGGMLSIAPPSSLVVAIDEIVSPMIERIVVAEREISRLSTLRDLLLPRLISGKLRVWDAESTIEKAIA